MANPGYRLEEIISQRQLTDEVWLMKIKGDFKGEPGQFYMLRIPGQDPLLPRPLSICDLDEEGISFLYQKVGRGTDLITKMGEGSKIEILGPLGTGFKLLIPKIGLPLWLEG